MHWFKIVDKDKKGNFKTLFHGEVIPFLTESPVCDLAVLNNNVDGSRIIPVGEWVKLEQKIISDYTTGTKYKSGWHIMNNHDECLEYLSKFTAQLKRVIVMVKIKGKLWSKEHSPSNVWLCEYIKIIGEV